MAFSVRRVRGTRGFYIVPQRRTGEFTTEKKHAMVEEGKCECSSNIKTNMENVKKSIEDFRLDNNNSTELLIQEARKYAIDEDRLTEIVEYICEKTFKEPEFARVAARIGETLCGAQFENGLSFRKSLLRKTQEYFKDRQTFHKKSLTEWVGLVSFICQLFNVLRINNQPMKPLAVPIYQMLNELLRGRQFEEISCFHRQLKDTGLLLDAVDKEKMNDLYMKMRIILIHTKSPEFTQLLLLELLELRSGKWMMSKNNVQYYVDTCKELLGNALVGNAYIV